MRQHPDHPVTVWEGPPELRALLVPIDQLAPLPGNPRRGDIEAVARSLQAFGQRKAITHRPSDRIVTAGNHTRLAALSLGWTHVASVGIEDDDATAKSWAIADNRTSDLAVNDDADLAAMLQEIQAADAELLAAASYTDTHLADLLKSLEPPFVPRTDPDDVPEPPAVPVTQPGDVWVLDSGGGHPHRLICGDATNAENVARVLDGATPALMVTDPPYGVEYDPAWRQEAAEAGHLAYAPTRVGEVTSDDRVDWSDAWLLSPSRVVYCWHAGRHASSVQTSLEKADYRIRCQIVWAKRHFPISRGHYHWRHEPLWYAVREGPGGAGWIGDRSQTTVWDDITLDANVEGGHSTQKPVECMARPIRNHDGDVYDPFVGSGSTVIAAEMVGRSCYAIEIKPAYCDVVVARWERFTGGKASRLQADLA